MRSFVAALSGSSVALVFLAALLLRCYVATFPHSGQATPPKFGDYEARAAALAQRLSPLSRRVLR